MTDSWGTGMDSPFVLKSGASAAPAPPAVVVLGGTQVVPPLLTALHTSGVAATWAVDEQQAAQLLGVLPGSLVVVTDDSAETAELPDRDVIDVRGVATSADDRWAATVALLIANVLPRRVNGTARHHHHPAADLVIDEHHWCVRYRGRPLRLTDAQYQLLSLLVRCGDRMVFLQQLARDMFDSDHCERERIHAHVKRLRVRLAEETDGRFSIVAVRGLGYRLADTANFGLTAANQ
jgi:Transcriptional regulatory protein, C terminal